MQRADYEDKPWPVIILLQKHDGLLSIRRCRLPLIARIEIITGRYRGGP